MPLAILQACTGKEQVEQALVAAAVSTTFKVSAGKARTRGPVALSSAEESDATATALDGLPFMMAATMVSRCPAHHGVGMQTRRTQRGCRLA